jgi:hypothetical protein
VSEFEDVAVRSAAELRRHRAALGNYVKQMALSAGAGKSPMFDATDVLKEIAGAASTCREAILFFGDEDSFPPSLLTALGETQQEIAHATNALVLVLATLRRGT